MADIIKPIEEVVTPEELERVKEVEIIETELGKEESPIFLEDTGRRSDIQEAHFIVLNQLKIKIIKGTATEMEIARYNALK